MDETEETKVSLRMKMNRSFAMRHGFSITPSQLSSAVQALKIVSWSGHCSSEGWSEGGARGRACAHFESPAIWSKRCALAPVWYTLSLVYLRYLIHSAREAGTPIPLSSKRRQEWVDSCPRLPGHLLQNARHRPPLSPSFSLPFSLSLSLSLSLSQ